MEEQGPEKQVAPHNGCFLMEVGDFGQSTQMMRDFARVPSESFQCCINSATLASCSPVSTTSFCLLSHHSNEHFDSQIIAVKPCRAAVTGEHDMSSSDSSHTLASYKNKPERKKRAEQRGISVSASNALLCRGFVSF